MPTPSSLMVGADSKMSTSSMPADNSDNASVIPPIPPPTIATFNLHSFRRALSYPPYALAVASKTQTPRKVPAEFGHSPTACCVSREQKSRDAEVERVDGAGS